MSDRDSAACDAAFLSAATLTRVAVKGTKLQGYVHITNLCAVKGGSELFDPFQGACGAALSRYVQTCLQHA
jgi:hypothetical protein